MRYLPGTLYMTACRPKTDLFVNIRWGTALHDSLPPQDRSL
jgi:hypothetical protein